MRKTGGHHDRGHVGGLAATDLQGGDTVACRHPGTGTDEFSTPSIADLPAHSTRRVFGTLRVVIAGHAFMQNARRGHYELGVEADQHLRVRAAFNELTETI